jgi:hypothetical protein
MMPESLPTNSIAARARMNRASQADNRLAFRCCRLRLPCAQNCHYGAPFLLAHYRPACDLVEGAPAADTKA